MKNKANKGLPDKQTVKDKNQLIIEELKFVVEEMKDVWSKDFKAGYENAILDMEVLFELEKDEVSE